MLKLTWTQAASWRVRRQYLDRPAPPGSILAIASRLCGLHAQVLSSAELTLWTRMGDLERGAIERALWQDRTLVKTWAMRGTLHLLPATELPLWHAALGTSPRYLKPVQWQKHFGITMDELDRLSEAVGPVLDGRVLTREELAREVGRLTGAATLAAKLGEGSWGTILKPAAFNGHLCFGPSLGQRVRFTRPYSWLSAGHKPVDPKTAVADVTRRFLAAYGPARCRDLARWWGGGGITGARQWLASLSDEVAQVDLEGSTAWMLAADIRELREIPPGRSVRLLPGFDQYVIAASCYAEHLLPGVPRTRVYRPQGWISPVLLVNGRMEGTWRHETKGSRIDLTIEPFGTPKQWVRRAADNEAERLAAFLGRPFSLTWVQS